MQDDERGVQVEADHRAHKAIAKAAGISWPLPTDRRLDQLVALANDAGASTRRNELAAAVLAACEPDGEHLLQLIVEWRRALVRNVVLDVEDDATVVRLPRYRPGRRKSGTG